MGKKDRRGKQRFPPFTAVFNEQMDSQAFLELTGTAVKVLLYFKRIDGKVRKKAGPDYNGIIDFTYSEAEQYGFARSTFSRAIDELNEKGFIAVIKVGGLRGVGRSNSKYQLIEGWRQYGQTFGGKAAFTPKPRRPTEP